MRKLLVGLASGLLMAGHLTPAHAIEELTPEPTQLYRVVDVSAGDVLNMRVQPDPTSDVIGTLEPDASGVVVAGTRMEMDGAVWWQVVDSGQIGWVNARFLAPLDQAPGERDGFPLQCSGTEPFWSMAVDDGSAVFESPGAEPESWQAGQMSYATGLIGRFAVRLENEGTVGHVAAWRNYQFCSDGMSDIGHPYEGILVTPGGEVYGGCCHRAGP